MFLRSAWYVAGWSSEFAPGAAHARTIINEPLMFMRQVNGTLVALTDRCAHRRAPLSKGRIGRYYSLHVSWRAVRGERSLCRDP